MSLIPPYVERLTPYSPGKPVEELERELGIRNAIKLASNESPVGPSPRAVEAIRELTGGAHRYPDAATWALRSDLAAHHDAQRRSAEQPLRFDVPSLAREQRVPCGGEAALVGRGGAGHEARAGSGWKREHVEQPRDRRVLERGVQSGLGAQHDVGARGTGVARDLLVRGRDGDALDRARAIEGLDQILEHGEGERLARRVGELGQEPRLALLESLDRDQRERDRSRSARASAASATRRDAMASTISVSRVAVARPSPSISSAASASRRSNTNPSIQSR